MSKSYVTQFTEYVSKQQDSLRNKLKAKGLSPSPNATLGSLVSDLDSLQESFGTEKYERDPNFPDIDTMFDNDPLRYINGGPYKGCSYFIMQVDANNNVGFLFAPIQTTTSIQPHYYGEKVIVSDGTEYENLTSTWTHTVDPSGIFYGEDGFSYCLLKVYRTDVIKIVYGASSYAITKGVIELIEDTFVGFYPGMRNTEISGYSADQFATRYFRYVGTEVTEADMSVTNIQWMSPFYSTSNWGAYSIKCMRVDGNNKFTFTGQGGVGLQKLILNGQSYATSNSVGSSGSSYPDTINYIEYLKLPYNKTSTTSSLSRPVRHLFIPDSYTQVTLSKGSGNSYAQAISTLESVHLGNGLTTWIAASSASLMNLKYITTSDNIYGTNTSAITIDLINAQSLTKQSVLNLFNGVADRTGMTANIIKLSARIKGYLSDEEKSILTNKNWTLS